MDNFAQLINRVRHHRTTDHTGFCRSKESTIHEMLVWEGLSHEQAHWVMRAQESLDGPSDTRPEDYEACSLCGWDHSYEPAESQAAHAKLGHVFDDESTWRVSAVAKV